MHQTRLIKDGAGNVLTDAWSVTGRWKEYFEELMKSRRGEPGGS